MKKYIFLTIVAIFAAWFIVDGFNSAHATGKKCPPGQYAKGWKCFPIEDGGDGDITINNNNNPKAYGGSVNIGNGFGNKVLSPSAKATAVAGAIGFFDVDNEIDMDQKQNQKQKQKQSQDQLQLQGQIGINKQGQTAHNEGVKQKVKVTVEGDTYEAEPNHINPVSGPDTDTQTVKSHGTKVLTFGSVVDRVSGLGIDQIKLLARDADDVNILMGTFFEPEDGVNYVRIGTDGEFSGYIYATCDDDECPAAGMEGKILKAAAEAGFTSVNRLDKDAMEKLYASEWSVKLGGGASVAADGGRMMIAPGGGIGGGAAESHTIELPAMVFEVFYNPLFIKVK